MTLLSLPVARRSLKTFGINMESIQLKDLGRAKKIEIDKENRSSLKVRVKVKIKGRIEQIKKEISITTSDYDREKLQEKRWRRWPAGGAGECAG